MRCEDAVGVLSSEDYTRLAPAAAAPDLAVLFGTGPFARLDDFDREAQRQRSPLRDAIAF